MADLKAKILAVIGDDITDLLYYDRKECEYLPMGAIQQAIKDGVITADEIVEHFKTELIKGLGEE